MVQRDQRACFRKTPLALAVSLAVANGGALAQEETQTAAQPADERAVEEVVVACWFEGGTATCGLRESLQASMELKRTRDGVVDAITAEDIGNFPDTNLAESLQRITGVSIDRERGEGARVTVRGFGPDFNLVLLNGRQMPTTSGLGRSFDFGDLASEGVAAVEIHKSGRADMPTGGVGSTINIRTAQPLDAPGMRFRAALSGLHDRSADDATFTPEMSALFSNTFQDDTVGIALSVVRQSRESGVNTGNVGGWRTFPGEKHNNWGAGDGNAEWGGIPQASDPNQQNRPGPGDLYSVPQAIAYELAEFERMRTNGQLTLQWRANEDVVATLDYTYSELELERTYSNLSAWFNFAGQQTAWTDGPQASPLVYAENSSNSDFSMAGGQDAWRTNNRAVGLNLLWDVSEALSLEFDHHDATADRSPNSRFGDSSLLSTAAFSRDKTTGYFGSDLPVLELTLNNPLTPDDMIVTGSVFQNNVSTMDITQTRVAGTWDLDMDFVDSVDFGVQLTDVDNRSAGSVVQRDAWGGVTQPGAIADLLTPASAASAFDNVPGGTDVRRQTDYFTFDMAALVARTEALMASGEATVFQVPDMGDCGTGLCTSSRFTGDRRTTEESAALYVQVHFDTAFGTMPVGLRLGARYETTDVESEALAPNYTGLDWVAGNELTPVGAGEGDFTSLSGDYSVFLPSLDFRIDFTDDWVGRVSYSETITRPNYGDIQGGQTIDSPVRVESGTGNRGNPALLPFESANLDFSFEYYYAADSYLAIGYYRKAVENFIGTSRVTETTFDLPHPALGPLGDAARTATGSTEAQVLYEWILENRADEPGVDAARGVISGVAGRDPSAPFNLTVPVNIEQATMSGWELVVQHSFGDSGFGAIVNATFADADVEYDNFSLAQQFVLTGLSDSANVIAFYDKNGVSVRLAYNWRDSFLAGTGQANVGAGPPSYVAAYQQLDLSASYWVTDAIQVYVDALNITDQTTLVHGRSELQTLFAAQLGARYNLGLRYNF